MTRLIDKTIKSALIAALAFTSVAVLAQDTTQHQRSTNFYTFVYNQIPENSNIPAIGLVNMAEGNQKGVQVGFTNVNQKNLHGTQIGFTNVVGGATKGAQIGFVNACRDSITGAQVGYINVNTDKVDGAQVGFVNVSRANVKGAQVAYVNIASEAVKGSQVGFVNVNVGKTDGAQVGYVNVSTNGLNGAQVGFVNTTVKDSKGSQVGFVNAAAGTLRGSQVGFVNVVDSISGGIPVGFISIVRKNGYYAIEVSANEMYPANLSFKIGSPHLYTFFTGSYNPDFKKEFALGAGFGSNFQLSRRLYLNPEVMMQNTVTEESQMYLNLATHLGFSLTDHWSLVAGPSVTWSHMDNDEKEQTFNKPSFSLYEENIDARNRLHLGARFAIRYRF